MSRLTCLVVALLAAVLLGGCASDRDSMITPARAEARPVEARPPSPKPAPAARNGEQPSAPSNAVVAARPKAAGGAAGGEIAAALGRPLEPAMEGKLGATAPTQRNARVTRGPASVGKSAGSLQSSGVMMADASSSPVASPELDADKERMRQRDAYIKGLQIGGYSFSPPSPIKVEELIPVALWVDPAKDGAQLAEEMKKAFPDSAARVEGGQTPWSPRMRATLTGVGFEITPIEGKDFDGVKDLSMTGPTMWKWTLLPTTPGKKQQLHLVLEAMLPPALGKPWEKVLDREVDVEVTWWWVIDHFWEKYWKWILSGLGAALASAIAWWWKKRFGGGG